LCGLHNKPPAKKELKQLTDEQLMHDVAKGNLDAMTFIFERYHLRIYNFLFQMTRDKAVAEDLTQNVFYKAIRYKSSYQGGQFASWIFKIARNLFSDYYQKQKRSQHNVVFERIADEDLDTSEDKTEDVAHLQTALKRLKAEERELIVMNRLQGMKYDKIAEITGSSEGAVKVKVHRIIKKLRTVYFETI
jgi:RNA polymerase sigma-70 factor (ECF subfamily)